jgi:hypothetical protein
MKRILILTLLYAACVTAKSQIISTPSGPLEFIGLRHRTPQQLWDSIYALTPHDGAHACASVLTQVFKYPDASVVAYPEGDSIYWVVTVIEPEDKSRVSYHPRPKQWKPVSQEWNDFMRGAGGDGLTIQIALDSYPLLKAGKADSAASMVQAAEADDARFTDVRSTLKEDVQDIWQFIQHHDSQSARDSALRVLAYDGSTEHRSVALIILSNFPQDTVAIYALVDELRDRDASIHSLSQSILDSWIRMYPQNIDWHSMIPTLRHLLAGTNLFAFRTTLDLLMSTGLNPELGRALLRDNGYMLLAHLQAKHAEEQERAYSFLKQASGQDFGTDTERWAAWINGLN